MTKLIKLKDSYGDVHVNPMMIESLIQQKMEGTNSTIVNMMSGRTHVVKHSVKEVKDMIEGKNWSTIYNTITDVDMEETEG